MPDLLLELFSEEIPARMQGTASEELARRFEQKLSEARLSFEKIERFFTPRRLAVRVLGLPEVQPDLNIEKKGPKLGAPQGAIEGFCRSVGLPLDQLEQREIKGETFYFASQAQRGQTAAQALGPLIEALLRDFPWPKSMRWGAHEMHWVRPLRRILCLLGEQIVPVTFGHLTSSNITEGHRFLSSGEIALAHPGEYEAKLMAAHVIADPAERRARIERDAAALAESASGRMRADDGLLGEVTGLVEWPVVLLGEFEPEYLELPPEVLVLEMRHHQKYFAVEKPDGTLTNRFLTVANMTASDGGAAIIRGNRRVLRARLEDGRFYWEQDKEVPLGEMAEKLSGMLFHAKLSSMADKAKRVETLASDFASTLTTGEKYEKAEALREKAVRAAKLAKADLVSGMVGEFPELQGIMGRYYAMAQGEAADVADAIRDHYKPVGADDDVPTDKVAIAVALADKLDSLVSLFAVGERPTGSKDPFALRRATLGIIRIILENGLRINLGYPIRHAWGLIQSQLPEKAVTANAESAFAAEILAFLADRLKVMLKDKGVRHDLIAAVFAKGDEDDLVTIVEQAKALQSFLMTEDGANLLAGYRRASNIVVKEEKKDGLSYAGEPNDKLFVQQEENDLFVQLDIRTQEFDGYVQTNDYAAAMQSMAALRGPIDRFFDQVKVNDENPKLRINRLHLLSAMRHALNQIASFEKIEG